MDQLAISALALEIIGKFSIARNIPYAVGSDSYLSAEDALTKMIATALAPKVKLDLPSWEAWVEGGGN